MGLRLNRKLRRLEKQLETAYKRPVRMFLKRGEGYKETGCGVERWFTEEEIKDMPGQVVIFRGPEEKEK